MKQKRTYSRRQKALRWLLRLVALVLLLNITGIYYLSPDQTIPSNLQESGLLPTEVVHREWANRKELDDWLLMVSENEQAIVLTAASFHPLTGWYDRSGTNAIVRADPESYDRSWTAHKRDSDTEWVCLFGFVPHGEQPPTFKAGVYDYRAPFDEEIDTSGYTLVGETYFDGEPITITPTPTIPVKGGMCYLTQLSVTYKTVDQNRYDVAVLCDRTGQWEKCKYWTSTSF